MAGVVHTHGTRGRAMAGAYGSARESSAAGSGELLSVCGVYLTAEEI
jgi:hypothetical protein